MGNACFQLRENWVRVRTMSPEEGNNCGIALIKDLLHKTMENRSPVVWVGKTMLDPTVDPDVLIDVRNPVTKKENLKSMCYCRDTISTLKQHPMT